MKYYGDISEQDIALVEQLKALENWFYSEGYDVPPLSAAKGMVSLAHDYFLLEMEEEGERLLNLAEKQYPGYFKGAISVHAEQDRDYFVLVGNLKKTLALETMISLGYNLPSGDEGPHWNS